MLPANLLNTIKALAFEQKSQLTTVTELAQKVGQFEEGQKLQGSVQAQVSPGVFKVRIADQLIQMQLPPSIRSGDTVALQVIATQPRLTFSMVNSASPLSTPEQLGSAARLLSALSQQPPEKASVRTMQTTPLWEQPQPPESKQLAVLLRETLSNSGLFYESHQAQWLEGARSTAQLLHEPQNLPPEQVKAAMPGDNTGKAIMPNDNAGKAAAPNDNIPKTVISNDAASKLVTAGDVGNNAATVAGTASTAATDNAANTTNTSSSPSNSSGPSNTTSLPEGKTLGIPEHLQPLVQQQLNALETRQMLWQGNVWPDQPMQWEVHEQAPQRPGMDEQRQWVTQVRLDLPTLGEVAATLRFNSAGLSLTLNAATPETRTVLGNASTRLVATLSDAGIPVLSTQVTTL